MEQWELREQLLAYCERDTLALVRLREFLRGGGHAPGDRGALGLRAVVGVVW